MKPNELRQKSDAELKKLLGAQLQKTQEGRFQLAAGKQKNVRGLRYTRQMIAQILTVLRERQNTQS